MSLVLVFLVFIGDLYAYRYHLVSDSYGRIYMNVFHWYRRYSIRALLVSGDTLGEGVRHLVHLPGWMYHTYEQAIHAILMLKLYRDLKDGGCVEHAWRWQRRPPEAASAKRKQPDLCWPGNGMLQVQEHTDNDKRTGSIKRACTRRLTRPQFSFIRLSTVHPCIGDQRILVATVTGGACYINQNPRWTQKQCIPLCLHPYFGSDYYVIP